jgi:uncharacterized protein YuzE
MFRSMLSSVVLLAVCACFVVAEDAKPKIDKDAKEAKITKMDGKKSTVTVKMQEDGKDVEKTFKLAEDIEYQDSTGKVATIEIFTAGDMVLYVEVDGKITKMKKKEKADTKKPEDK